MNVDQAKKIEIVGYLQSMGIKPVRYSHGGMQAVYHSPFRKEHCPSFFVNTSINRWFDHGEGVGGNMIDLVVRLNNVNCTQALEMIRETPDPQFFSFHKQLPSKITRSNLSIIKTHALRHPALINYLKSRAIRVENVFTHLVEVHYQVNYNSVDYFAIGFKNDLGGYELRNKYFKGGSSPKHYSFIRGKSSSGLNIFEGFMDFMSLLSVEKSSIPKFDTLVLNSVAMIKKCKSYVTAYPVLYLYLDNDVTGKKVIKQFTTMHNCIVNKAMHIYPSYKDLNDYLIFQQRNGIRG